jgi:hypothetical protein
VPLPPLIPTDELTTHFAAQRIACKSCGDLELGFGAGNPHYRLYDYPAPASDETMGVFFEWHTEDFFSVTGGHLAVGLNGPLPDDPHRGRGLAIGHFAGWIPDPDQPGKRLAQFPGCPGHPGGPSMFLEEFTVNEGRAAAREWQLTPGRQMDQLVDGRIYRIDIHVSRTNVWAGVWQKHMSSRSGAIAYTFLDQVSCRDRLPFDDQRPAPPCHRHPDDRDCGNAFIGTAFADPETRSCVRHIHIAHWQA